MSHSDGPNDFAPSDTTDHRKRWEWRSKYESEAQHQILIDAIYIALLLAAVVACYPVLWLGYPEHWLGLSDEQYGPIRYYGLAWVSGTLGGTLFDLKWLYHSVAKGLWHLDRRLWRLFTPHISGGLSFAVIALVSADAIRLFDSVAVKSSLPTVVGLAFLIGYFSDSAIAKLSEVAETLFGVVRKSKGHPSTIDRQV